MHPPKKLIIEPPDGKTPILLHACCAPCSGAILEALLANDLRPSIFYSNANIYPEQEYRIRREECLRYSSSLGLEFIEDEYDHKDWQRLAKGLESEHERGLRCLRCFHYRLERAARYAQEHGYRLLTTTLASSRWKNIEQVNTAGQEACRLFPDVSWWPMNWRKAGLQERRSEIIREQNFYNQLYCGCEYSLKSKP